ncbi:glucan biosynthesis protein D [Thioclava sp. SK-1]|uniref:glucan biosynthesis protein n=1 Tax=Thioclava sp. SK-1 TaxID=1889770 RepID=UPI0008258BCB|nr:glucan biosynthesis protein G [Thioclava sp. SK-1]OCX66960.1 glucan biosynthesis protein D [Thioclava sp. SK-1]
MSNGTTSSSSRLNRRQLLAGLGFTTALGTVVAFPANVLAQSEPATAPELPPAAEQKPFSFDLLTQQAQQLSTQPAAPAQQVDGFLTKLTYDDYRLIRFNPERARFADVENTQFTLQAFHMGWLFREPVVLHEVIDGQSQAMTFGTDDFIYERQARDIVPEHAPLPGVAGFRLHHPLNRPDIMDELVAFQGASYFRALGRGSAYGLSARGLALNTGLSVAEEFPRFTQFWIERPAEAAGQITLYAAMESKSLTGAYKFIITPGQNTEMVVTARLFFREDIPQLGVAPLTSMFLYADRNRAKFDDFRPQVHDSDGLMIERASGDVLWRPLANPPHLASSYFSETAPKSFGLYQRDRDFDQYQDGAAHYERRPSLKVEPIGDWGKGVVRLVEIPSDLEVNDNIVAFWVPEAQAKKGGTFEISYKLSWGDLPVDASGDLAHVLETRAGAGGVSGVESNGTRKFVIDFAGGLMSRLPEAAVEQLKPIITINNGSIASQSFSKIPGQDIWRLVMDVAAENDATVELSAHIAGFGIKQTETWAYQWIKA